MRESWQDIQLRHDGWNWRVREFDMVSEAGGMAYSWDSMAQPDGSRSIPGTTGFRRWLGTTPDPPSGYWWFIRDPDIGNASGSVLPWVPFGSVRNQRLREPDRSGKPTMFTVDPTGRVLLWPVPEKAYTVSGMFVKGVQRLVNDSDTPEGIDEEFHDAIKWLAVSKLHALDDQYDSSAVALQRFRELVRSMDRKYLPAVKFGGPIA